MSRNFESVLATAIIFGSLTACGDGGDGFKSLKGAKPAELSSSELNASNQAMYGLSQEIASEDAEGVDASFYKLHQTAMTFGGNDSETRTINSTFSEPCPTSGTLGVAVKGTATKNTTESDLKFNYVGGVDATASECRGDEGMINGTFSSKVTTDIRVRRNGDSMDLFAKMIRLYSGKINAEGLTNGSPSTHSIEFVDFGLKIEFDSKTLEKISSSSDQDQALEVLKCKGSVILDSKTIPCEQFIMATINHLIVND